MTETEAQTIPKSGRYMSNEELEREWEVSHEALKRFREDPHDPLPFMRAGRRYVYVRSEIEAWARRRGRQGARAKRRAVR